MDQKAVVFDVTGLDWWTELYAVEAVQGLANRNGPKIMFGPSDYSAAQDRPGSPWNKDWLRIYSERNGMQFEPMKGLLPLLERFRHLFKGIVVYDPAIDGTRCVAMTLAGTDSLLPVTKEMLAGESSDLKGKLGFQTLENILGLEITEDLTGRFRDSVEVYEWALEHVMPKCNRRWAHTPSGPDVDGLYIGLGPFRSFDWTIANRGFIFNLTLIYEDEQSFGGIVKGDRRQADMYRTILDALEAPAFIFGYGEFEWSWFMLVGEKGHYYLHWGDNMSFHAKVPPRNAERKQKFHFAEKDIDENDRRYRVCFVTSEGDTMKGPTPFFFGSWNDPQRGAAPINWTVPALMSGFPAMLDYYYETATENDYFVAFDIFNFRMPTFSEFIKDHARRYREADLRVSVLTERSRNDERLDEFVRAVKPLGVASIEWLSPGRKAYQRKLSDGTPLVCCSDDLGYWQAKITGSWGSEWADDIKDPVKRRDLIEKLVANIEAAASQLAAPGPVIVYGDTHRCNELSAFYADVTAALNPKRFKAARLDEGLLAARLLLPDDIGGGNDVDASEDAAKLFEIQKDGDK
ncbi:MAG: hypothetical protein AB7E95_04480 [Kiritimatiellales bacterium]